MDFNSITRQVKKSIKENNGMVDYSYWKGFCKCYDQMNNAKIKTDSWERLKPIISNECKKIRQPFIQFLNQIISN